MAALPPAAECQAATHGDQARRLSLSRRSSPNPTQAAKKRLLNELSGLVADHDVRPRSPKGDTGLRRKDIGSAASAQAFAKCSDKRACEVVALLGSSDDNPPGCRGHLAVGHWRVRSLDTPRAAETTTQLLQVKALPIDYLVGQGTASSWRTRRGPGI